MGNDQIKDAKKKLAEINETISALDPAIRGAAFEVLVPLYFEDHEPPQKGQRDRRSPKQSQSSSDASDPQKFFAQHDHDKPGDNVNLIAAWLYSRHGVIPISQKDLQETASDVGIIVPSRADNTMRFAMRDGKNLYRKKDKGWQLTVNGEAYLKSTYHVKKGNKRRASGGDK